MESDRAASPGGFRIATWNLHGASRPDLGGVVAALTDESVDVVALQEVRRRQAVELADRLGGLHVRWLLKHRPWGAMAPRLAEGLAVLSRYPVVSESTASLTPEVGLNTHRRRVLQEVVLDVDGEHVRVVNVHLDSARSDRRAEQAQRAAALLGVAAASGGTDRTVLAGDLNTGDERGVLEPFARLSLVDAPAGATSPAGRAVARLDHILVGAALVATRVRVPDDGPAWARLSDHLPVFADVAPRG